MAWLRTKIICTLGPSTDKPGVLEELVRAGLNVARLNTAHGTAEEHAGRIRQVRDIANRLGVPVGVLVDLPGPKLRLGRLRGGSRELLRDTDVILDVRDDQGDGPIVPVTYPHLTDMVRAGESLYLADGTVTLVVTAVEGSAARCRVEIGGIVRSGSGLNVPDSQSAAALPTDEDRKWIAFACAHQAEWVGVSFVRTAEDLVRVRSAIGHLAGGPAVMAKIEKRQALDHVDEIVAASDGVMVARGDLGVETPLAEVPIAQKRIIAAACAQARPVVIATQMLESMVTNPSPTRAEVSDVANAILDGADAVMLSAETAIGAHAVAAVRMVRDVITATESRYPNRAELERRDAGTTWQLEPDAISFLACRLSRDVQAKAIVAPAESGRMALRIARFGPSVPIIALCETEHQARQLALAWGIVPLVTPDIGLMQSVRRKLVSQGWAHEDDAVVLVATSLVEPGRESHSVQVVRL